MSAAPASGLREPSSVADAEKAAENVKPNEYVDREFERIAAVEAEKVAPADFPDGGLRAWLVVFGSWLVSAASFGYISAFGTYQLYYETHQLRDANPSSIAWIGSLQLFLIFFSGSLSGSLFDAGYYRSIVASGMCLLILGIFTTAQCTTLWQFILAQGVCGGTGAGFLFQPSAAVLSHWFRKRRALAYGVIATGSSTGGVIFPIMLNRLFVQVGFSWAVRIAGFVVVALLVPAYFLMAPRLPPRKRGRIFEFHHLKDPAYTLLCAAAFCIFLGLYTPIFNISSYAKSKGMDTELAFYTLAILNACSILGRLVPNLFADKFGPQNILYPASGAAGILCFCWLGTSSSGGIIGFACIYAICSGAYVSTIPACIANITTNMTEIGARTSLGFAFISFAALIGTPVSGALYAHGGWVGPACFAGSVVLFGVALGLAGRRIVAKRSNTWKV